MSSSENEDRAPQLGGRTDLMVTSQLVISSGFDEEGDPSVWVENIGCNSIIEALGMLEYAKSSMLSLHASGQ